MALGSLHLDKAEVVWEVHQAQVVVEIFGLEQLVRGGFTAHERSHSHKNTHRAD